MYVEGSSPSNSNALTLNNGADVYIFKKCKCQYSHTPIIKELLCDPGLFVDGW